VPRSRSAGHRGTTHGTASENKSKDAQAGGSSAVPADLRGALLSYFRQGWRYAGPDLVGVRSREGYGSIGDDEVACDARHGSGETDASRDRVEAEWQQLVAQTPTAQHGSKFELAQVPTTPDAERRRVPVARSDLGLRRGRRVSPARRQGQRDVLPGRVDGSGRWG